MIEIITELEHKIEELIGRIETGRAEIDALRSELDGKNSYIHELEEANCALTGDLERTSSSAHEKDQKITESAERVRQMLSRLNAI